MQFLFENTKKLQLETGRKEMKNRKKHWLSSFGDNADGWHQAA